MRPIDWAAVLVVLAVGVGVAAYGIGRYEAWWTIAFAIGAFALAVAVGRQNPAGTIGIGVVVSVSIALGMVGVFLVWMGLHAGGAACMPAECSSSGPGLLLAGVAALVVAVLGLGITVRFARR